MHAPCCPQHLTNPSCFHTHACIHTQDQQQYGFDLPQQQQQQQAAAGTPPPLDPAEAAATASLEAAHAAALLSGDASSYATINALLKQLHDERLQRVVGEAGPHAAGAQQQAHAGGGGRS